MRTAYFVRHDGPDGDAIGIRVMNDGRVLYKRAPGAGDHHPKFRRVDDLDIFEMGLVEELKRNIRKLKAVLKRMRG